MLDEILKNLENCKDNNVYNDGECQVTYATLYMYVKRIYNFILENQNTKTPIIIYGHKSIYMISCMLSCSFAGIAYVPIDVSMPKDRIDNIIEVIKPEIILATENIELNNSKIISIDKIKKICNEEKKEQKEITPLMKKEDIYYIIFTSGSTRKTKRSENFVQ